MQHAASTGASMGMRAYYNIVADPELGGKVAARQIPTDNCGRQQKTELILSFG